MQAHGPVRRPLVAQCTRLAAAAKRARVGQAQRAAASGNGAARGGHGCQAVRRCRCRRHCPLPPSKTTKRRGEETEAKDPGKEKEPNPFGGVDRDDEEEEEKPAAKEANPFGGDESDEGEDEPEAEAEAVAPAPVKPPCKNSNPFGSGVDEDDHDEDGVGHACAFYALALAATRAFVHAPAHAPTLYLFCPEGRGARGRLDNEGLAAAFAYERSEAYGHAQGRGGPL